MSLMANITGDKDSVVQTKLENQRRRNPDNASVTETSTNVDKAKLRQDRKKDRSKALVRFLFLLESMTKSEGGEELKHLDSAMRNSLWPKRQKRRNGRRRGNMLLLEEWSRTPKSQRRSAWALHDRLWHIG